MGVVYKARQLSLAGKLVAIKILSREFADSPLAIKEFAEEWRSVVNLRHVSVIPILARGEIDGLPFYVMEYVEGCTLQGVVNEITSQLTGRGADGAGDLPTATTEVLRSTVRLLLEGQDVDLGPDERAQVSAGLPRDYFKRVATLVADVADALQYVHGSGLLHNDLKPSNIMLEARGRPLVVDFGLCTHVRKPSPWLGLRGTLPYMSPERVAAGNVTIDDRSDVYSLGATLYTLVTLRRPFEGDRDAVAYQVAFKEPVRPRRLNKDVPRDLEAVIMKAVEKAPDARYRSAAEFAEDLRRFAADERPVAKPRTVSDDVVRWARRNRKYLVGAAAALLICTVAGIANACVKRANVKAQIAQLIESGKALQGRGEYTKATMAYTEALSLARSIGRAPAGLTAAYREALGMRQVEITSAPTGASVYVYALDEATERVIPNTGQFLGTTPYQRPMLPGYYLFVLESRAGDFSEFRRFLVRPALGAAPEAIRIAARIRPKEDVLKDMIQIPAGECIVGAKDSFRNQWPERKVHVDEFYVDRTEVTNAQYKAFVDATGCPAPLYWRDGVIPEGRENCPVRMVSRDDAMAYAEWAGKRLLHEVEWEKAMRGTDARLYPWGITHDPSKVTYFCGDDRTWRWMPVGSRPEGASPYGVLDGIGSVGEFILEMVSDPTRNRFMSLVKGNACSQFLENGREASPVTVCNRMHILARHESGLAVGIRCGRSVRKPPFEAASSP